MELSSRNRKILKQGNISVIVDTTPKGDASLFDSWREEMETPFIEIEGELYHDFIVVSFKEISTLISLLEDAKKQCIEEMKQ